MLLCLGLSLHLLRGQREAKCASRCHFELPRVMYPDDIRSFHWEQALLSLVHYHRFDYFSCPLMRSTRCHHSNIVNYSCWVFCHRKHGQDHGVYCFDSFLKYQRKSVPTVLFYTSDQADRKSYMTDEIPCNSGKSLLLQRILLWVHTKNYPWNKPQVTVSKSVRNFGFRVLTSRTNSVV